MHRLTLTEQKERQPENHGAPAESCHTGCARRPDRLMKYGIVGTVITALCCFTPVLVVLFGFLGLAGLVGYLDYVLFPLLAVFLLLIFTATVRGIARPDTSNTNNAQGVSK